MTTKGIVAGLFIIVVIGAAGYVYKDKLFGAPKPPSPQTTTTIKIGVFPSSPNAYYPLYVAKQKGYFAEEGLNVELVDINPGLSVPALLSGELDYAQYLKEVVAAALKDAPVKVVSLYAQEPAYALVAQKGLALKDIKKVGVNFPRDGNHYQALQEIHDDKLNATVTTSNAQALLASKQIDAVVLNLADSYKLAEQGYTVLKILKSDSVSGFTTHTDTIKNHPEQVAAVIRAREKAFAFIKANPEEAKTLLLESLKLDKTASTTELVNNIYNAISGRPDEPLPLGTPMEMLIKVAKAGAYNTYADIEKQTATPEDIAKAFDLSLMPRHE